VISSWEVNGQPAAVQTGADNAWGIIPANIPAGTVTGTVTLATPLTVNSFTVFISTDNFVTSTPQYDTPTFLTTSTPLPPSTPPTAHDIDVATFQTSYALSRENKALKDLKHAQELATTKPGQSAEDSHDATVALDVAEADLGKAEAAIPTSTDHSTESAYAMTDIAAALREDDSAGRAIADGRLDDASLAIERANKRKRDALTGLKVALKTAS